MTPLFPRFSFCRPRFSVIFSPVELFCVLFFFSTTVLFSPIFFATARLLIFPSLFLFSSLLFSLPFKKRERFVCDWDPFGVLPPAFFLHSCQLSLLLSSSSSIFSVFSSGVFARCAFPGPFPSGLAHPSSNSVPSHSLPPSFFYLQSRSSYFHPFQPPQHPYLPFYDLSFRPPPSPPLSSLSLTRRIFRFVLH